MLGFVPRSVVKKVPLLLTTGLREASNKKIIITKYKGQAKNVNSSNRKVRGQSETSPLNCVAQA